MATAIIRNLGLQAYQETWQAMQTYTLTRDDTSPDELWVVEHPPVYTLGLNGKREHLLNVQNIPVVQSDRGGQVTYHGPGQLVIYTLLDLKRLGWNIRQLVETLEQSMISALAQYGLKTYAKREAPGVYWQEQKMGSVGLRVKRGCCYHGLSLNNKMDLSPFKGINPCGFANLEVTQLSDLQVNIETYELAIPVLHAIYEHLP